MAVKGSIFSKMIILIVFLLLPVLGLYVYFNHVSEANTRRGIEQSALGRLAFFLSQVETNLDQMSFYSGQIAGDPTLQELMAAELGSDMFDKWKTVSNLSEKLRLLSTSHPWENRLTLYVPRTGETVSTDSSAGFQADLPEGPLESRWVRRPIRMFGREAEGFVYYLIEPASAKSRPREANFVIEVGFAERSLASMLDRYKESDRGDPFFYQNGMEPIVNRSADPELVRTVAALLPIAPQRQAWTERVRHGGQDYLVCMVYSGLLGMYAADYFPEDRVLSSIHASRKIFYLSIGMLFLIGAIATFMFHRHVQSPIRELVRGVQRLKKGDYTYRIRSRKQSEFQFLFDRFNEMTEEIRQLIEHVYEEQLRSREALLKQLQSQINPHFLYNSLNSIKTMSIIGNVDAVEHMIVNLGEFYRYTTRTENRLASVKEEMEFVRSYLSIQQLRMPRLQTDIRLSPEMERHMIPRILLQPVVENAVVHGVEPRPGPGIIAVTGEMVGSRCRITVMDNGHGLSGVQMAELEQKLASPLTGDKGCGLWNVHQRLQLEYGPDAGLRFFPSPLGGLGVQLEWTVKKGESEDGTSSDRG